MTLKIRILRCSSRLFIILVSLTVTLFSEKCLFPLDSQVVSCPTQTKNLSLYLLHKNMHKNMLLLFQELTKNYVVTNFIKKRQLNLENLVPSSNHVVFVSAQEMCSISFHSVARLTFSFLPSECRVFQQIKNNCKYDC